MKTLTTGAPIAHPSPPHPPCQPETHSASTGELPGAVSGRMPAVAQILARYERGQLEAFLSVAIDLLDVMDGDPDAEDATDLEDDFALSPGALARSGDGPGCETSDPSGQCDEDGINTGLTVLREYRGPGCAISDPDKGAEDENERDEAEGYGDSFSDRTAYRWHLRRIQRDRCFPRYRYLRDWRTGEVTGKELLQYQLLNDVPAPSRRQLMKRKRGMPRRPRA